MVSPKSKRGFTAAALTILAITTVLIIDDSLTYPEEEPPQAAFDLRGLLNHHRRTSIDLGGGNCLWTAPLRTVPEDIDFHKTLVAGFPSGDTRMAWVQMEALAGLPTQNDWDRHYNGYTNSPFIKTNYPHPAGTWSWGSDVDQVTFTVQYIRRSLVEYAYIESYISSSAVYGDKKNNLESKYGTSANLDAFYAWRDAHALSQIYFYGWVIDYWMEKGLYRDPYTHAIIDSDNWALWNKPEPIESQSDKALVCHRTKSPKNPWIQLEISKKAVAAHVAHGDFNGTCAEASQNPDFSGTVITETHLVHDHSETLDPNCQKISGGCEPAILISVDKLRDYSDGPSETTLIGEYLLTNRNVADYVIDRECWNCIWEEVIDRNKGPATFKDRKQEDDPNFSAFMLEEMIFELDRMVTKYSSSEWSANDNASRLVSLLSEHLVMLESELDIINSGSRTLTTSDVFGPHEQRPKAAVVDAKPRSDLMKKLRMRFESKEIVEQ